LIGASTRAPFLARLDQPPPISRGPLTANLPAAPPLVARPDRLRGLAQVMRLQPPSVDGRHDGPEQLAEVRGKCLELLVPRVGLQVLVEVPDEMHQALLLCAAKRVVDSVKV